MMGFCFLMCLFILCAGSPLESGPTATPLPDKKLLVFILERLQKCVFIVFPYLSRVRKFSGAVY